MFRAALTMCCLSLLELCVAVKVGQGAATISAGQHTLQANQGGQWIELGVSGGDAVAGIDLFVQVGDGGRELDLYGGRGGRPGPRISAVELITGTIFAGVSDLPINVGSVDLPQTAIYTLALLGDKPQVPAQGTLARLQIDTTGFYGGEWELRLENVLPVEALGGPYSTNFAGKSALIENGSLKIPITAGDFNSNQAFDAADIDALSLAIRNGSNDTKFDLNSDRLVNLQDHRFWVQSYAHLYFGDANVDGEFNSADLVSVFAHGEYEDATAGNSTWQRGDWSGDGDFNSTDLVLAFQDGGYERSSARAASTAVTVPEPRGLVSLLLMVSGMFCRRKRWSCSK